MVDVERSPGAHEVDGLRRDVASRRGLRLRNERGRLLLILRPSPA